MGAESNGLKWYRSSPSSLRRGAAPHKPLFCARYGACRQTNQAESSSRLQNHHHQLVHLLPPRPEQAACSQKHGTMEADQRLDKVTIRVQRHDHNLLSGASLANSRGLWKGWPCRHAGMYPPCPHNISRPQRVPTRARYVVSITVS